VPAQAKACGYKKMRKWQEARRFPARRAEKILIPRKFSALLTPMRRLASEKSLFREQKSWKWSPAPDFGLKKLNMRHNLWLKGS
jgi:hypothetical protein